MKLTLIILITALIGVITLPVSGFAEEGEKRDEYPFNAHLVFVNLRDGKIYSAIEMCFDRVNMRCRIDHYLFQKKPLDLGGNQFEDMGSWKAFEEKCSPKCVDVYGPANTYEICWNTEAIMDFDVDPCDLMGEEPRTILPSEVKLRPVCVVSSLPYVPVTRISEWENFFAPKSIDARKMIVGLPKKPLPDERTGEYIYNEGLYVENFWGRASRPSHVEPDYVLERTWYEAKYLLPIRSLIFGVRQDNSRYLDSIFLAEYDVALDEGNFDPEYISGSREGFSILKQNLRGFCQEPEKDAVKKKTGEKEKKGSPIKGPPVKCTQERRGGHL